MTDSGDHVAEAERAPERIWLVPYGVVSTVMHKKPDGESTGYIRADLSRAPALADECERLKAELATAREKFTMHTAAVHAWFSALLQELGIATAGDKIDVQTACSQAMDRVIELRDVIKTMRDWVSDCANRSRHFRLLPDSIVNLAKNDLALIDAALSSTPAAREKNT